VPAGFEGAPVVIQALENTAGVPENAMDSASSQPPDRGREVYTRLMAIAARFRCAGCGSDLIVLPSVVWRTLPESARDGFSRALEDLRDEEGRRFTLADEHGRFRCASCRADGLAPQIEIF
jgi:hypothetical protein